MKAFIFTAAAALGLTLISPSTAMAAPVRYNFELIVDTSGPFTSFLDFAINKSGTVVFSAKHDGENIGVFTRRGSGPLTTIRYTGTGSYVSINDGGTVVFTKPIARDRTGGGLFTGRGGPVTTIVAAGDISYSSINESGSIAFRRLTGPGDPGHSGPPSFDGMVYINGKVSQITNVYQMRQPVINNHNAVLLAEGNGIYTEIELSQGGAKPVLIIDTRLNDPLGSSFTKLSHSSLNDAGTIAFYGSKRKSETTSETGVFTITNGTVRTIVSTTTGKPGGYYGYTADISLNNNGTIAFAALLAPDRTGIFTGPDPIANKVIAAGDTLMGSTVTEVTFSPSGLSDTGALAFRAKLANGKYAIVRATPQVSK